METAGAALSARGAAGWPRIVLHADMDAFYAAVEQLDRPELRGKALLIGGTGPRGVVSTASYEARPFGVGSAMPMVLARRRCPHAIVLPPRFERYHAVSKVVMDTLGAFSPLVEPLSLDEAFVDMTGCEALFGDPRAMGESVRRAVFEATRLTVSVGVSATKYVAKVASDARKPDGLTVVGPDEVPGFLHSLPIDRLWGVGVRTRARLEARGLATIGDVAGVPLDDLERWFGKLGAHLHALAHGRDGRAVTPERDAKSIGSEHTLDTDIAGEAAIRPWLLRATDTVAHRLRAEGLAARGVRVKLRTADFRLHTRQALLGVPTHATRPLVEAAQALLREFDLRAPVRLVGVAAFDLHECGDTGDVHQFDLFDAPREAHDERLDRTLDVVHERFGEGALTRARHLDRGARPGP
ncbi:MAG: DNA polymerase IV [Thiotrichales bacterium]|nr:DNA polymerase IV [Thiotrichales bacterium]